MFLQQQQKTDIYQILSFSLAYFKRKVILLIKIYSNQKDSLFKQQLLTQLAKQHSLALSFIEKIRNYSSKIINQGDEKYIFIKKRLYQRFMYRIKQVIKNYLPHASIFHDLFIYLKKIQTYSFKQNCNFQSYIEYILQLIPTNIEKDLSSQLKLIKDYQNINQSNKETSQHHTIKNNNNNKKQHIKDWLNEDEFSTQEDFILRSQSIHSENKLQNQLRPIDIFNNYISPIQKCLDCDITHIRAIYFNLQKERENSHKAVHGPQKSLCNNGKTIKQIQQQMLNTNRFIQHSIKSYQRQYSKYQSKILRSQTQFDIKSPTFQTTPLSSRGYNQTPNSYHKKTFVKQNNNITFHKSKNQPIQLQKMSSQQDRIQLYKQIHNKRNNFLKMKSISVSSYKGHLQLCSQTKNQSKKMSLTFSNFKGRVNYNKKNTANNLKKKYQIFMNSYLCSTLKDSQYQENNNCTLEYQQKNYQGINNNWRNKTVEVKQDLKMYPKQQKKQFKTITVKGKQALIFIDKNISYQNESSLSSNIKEKQNKKLQSSTVDSKTTKQTKKITTFNEADNTVTTFMKGMNVNHRNYVNPNYRYKKLFDALNPELSIKTLKK